MSNLEGKQAAMRRRMAHRQYTERPAIKPIIMPAAPPERYTLPQIQQMLNLSQAQAWRLFHELPGVENFGTGTKAAIRVPRAVLEAFVESRTNTNPIPTMR